MEANNYPDTGVSTLNENIQVLLSAKDYPPSHIARLINRAIEDKRYAAYPELEGLRKGHFIEDPKQFHAFKKEGSIEMNGRTLRYLGWTMPSFEGASVFREIDELVTRFNPKDLNEDQVYNLMAIIVVAIGAAHAFPDGTGRTAVGVVDVMLRKYLGKKLDLAKLQSCDDRLTQAMGLASLAMLPEQYNPNSIYEKMTDGEDRVINIPLTEKNPIQEVQSFAKDFARSIVDHITQLDPKSIDDQSTDIKVSLEGDSIAPIASLLKEVSVESQKGV